MRGSKTGDDLFSSARVYVCVRRRDNMEEPELSITKIKMVTARFQACLTRKQIS